ncbi:putative NFACT, RNA-binding domain-containing protein [Plasmopara halstedii]
MCGFIFLKDFEDAGETEMFEELAPYLYTQHQHKKAVWTGVVWSNLFVAVLLCDADEKVQDGLGDDATDKAIALAEKNTIKTLEKQQTKRNEIYQRRKSLWYINFHWLLSSEKYLKVAGKDAHQNELLVKRYLRKGDVFVHADLHDRVLSVCRSSAWPNQIIAGAYWTHADQVSETAPTGKYLTTGSFIVRDKKHFIQPSRLEVGLAVLFRIDESCVNNHSRQVKDSALLTSDGVDEEDRKKGGKDVYSEKISTEATMLMTDKSTVILQPTLNKNVIDNFEKNERPDEDAAYTQQTEREGKKQLSAKERRDLKKGKTHDGIKDYSVKLEMGAEKSIVMTV